MKTININKILRNDRRSMTNGAPMGDSDDFPEDRRNIPLHCQRVYFIDGDYGPDGTYWGASDRAGYIYCAFNGGVRDDFAPAMGVRVYVRACTHAQAKAAVRAQYPDALFVDEVKRSDRCQ